VSDRWSIQAPLAGLQHACAEYDDFPGQEQDRAARECAVPGAERAHLRHFEPFMTKI
jgi:hypothetical protein